MNDTWFPSEAELIAYLEGRLDAERMRRLEAWLQAHPEQQQELEEIQCLEADLDGFPQPVMSSEEMTALRDSTMAMLKREVPAEAPTELLPQRRQGDRSLPRLWQWLPAAVAALVIGFVAGRQEAELPLAQSTMPTLGSDAYARVDGVDPASGRWQLPLGRQVAVKDLAVQPDERVRIELSETASYELTGRVSDEEIQSALGFVLRNDQDPDRRKQAIKLLDENCKGQEFCQILVYAMTQDPSSDVRKSAALALQDEHQDPLVRRSFLKMMVEDPAPDLRSFAGEVLSRDLPATEFGK